MTQYKNLKINPKAIQALKDFQMPAEYGFGRVISPVMIICDYYRGEWGTPRMIPYGPIQMHPTCKVLHYAQEIFEGLKAYRVEGKGPFLFRPEENWKRFNKSAERMAMPEMPRELFMSAVEGITAYSASYIPSLSGESLYIRPFMFTSEETLGIKPSDEFRFMVIASPSGSYFSADSLPVYIERDQIRACPGGVGAAKTGGNYAAGIQSAIRSQQHGCLQTIWLDAIERKYIEEMSGMNFMAVINDCLVTPKITDTILDGITRRSLLKLAEHLGITVKEESMEMSKLLNAIQSGDCTEAFACGTAATITPIKSFVEEDGTVYKIPYDNGPVAQRLREGLLALQEGRTEDPFNWVHLVEPASY
ncbi:MAG: branched-chain amino acid aminotransferase [Halobacteriovoraceae bacterium]|jgi:branched-chain amino acid aminotransferase|nr:branched-chain amino acid aminotransferase [Halobacteriovoraceae bacterium]